MIEGITGESTLKGLLAQALSQTKYVGSCLLCDGQRWGSSHYISFSALDVKTGTWVGKGRWQEVSTIHPVTGATSWKDLLSPGI